MLFHIFTQYKGSLIASFILSTFLLGKAAATTHDYSNQAVSLNLHQSPTWRALLHVKDNQPHIFDSSFLLSKNNFSLKRELLETINILFSKTTSLNTICRFPARYLWLSQKLNLSSVKLSECKDFQEFKNRAPIDDIALIYASENLVSPSSMMGHIFLKIIGTRTDQKLVSHSLSYFTEVRGFNLPKLLYDSLLVGKKGYFALNPYLEIERNYLKTEQRNIWTYHLELSNQQIQLIQAHLWELKDTQLTYLFDEYNCATFTYFILAVAKPEMIAEIPTIASPIDVVKSVNNVSLVSHVSVTPSSKWQTRMWQEPLSAEHVSITQKAVKNKNLNLLTSIHTEPYERYLTSELARSFSQYLFETKEISQDEHASLQMQNDSLFKDISRDFVVDLSNYKNPILTPPDSQFYSGLVTNDAEGDFLRLGYLPAAKKAEDDNRQYFGETDLRIFDVSILISNKPSPKIQLEEFSLYSISSLLPRDNLTGGLSGRFGLGVEQHHNKTLKSGSAFNINAGIGLSFSPSTDILIYGIAGLGEGYRAGKFYTYTDPEIGLVVNEIFDMKSKLSFQQIWNQDRSGESYLKIRFDQSMYLNQSWGAFFGYERLRNDAASINQFEFTLKYYH